MFRFFDDVMILKGNYWNESACLFKHLITFQHRWLQKDKVFKKETIPGTPFRNKFVRDSRILFSFLHWSVSKKTLIFLAGICFSLFKSLYFNLSYASLWNCLGSYTTYLNRRFWTRLCLYNLFTSTLSTSTAAVPACLYKAKFIKLVLFILFFSQAFIFHFPDSVYSGAGLFYQLKSSQFHCQMQLAIFLQSF